MITITYDNCPRREPGKRRASVLACALATDNARNIETRARNGEGLYLLSWNGETLPPQDAQPGMLQTHAASTSVFAWLAVAQPPPAG